jgi:hypothetical protein
MSSDARSNCAGAPTRFDPARFSIEDRFTCIGTGSLGAKAHGLAGIRGILETTIAPSFAPAVQLDIPRATVITAGFFDLFIEQNALSAVASSPLADHEIAAAFQKAALPPQLVGDLRAFLAQVRVPLAVRSSSLLEDAMREPFAGVYATRLVRNDHPDLEGRLEELAGAIKYIYASTFFKKAKEYFAATGHSRSDERMAVLIQEVVGTRRNDRFYPHVSGVARSCNFYPLGIARPEDGVVELALGLGTIIVDEGVAWSYSPACPQASPPYNTPRDLLNQTQKDFWAIDLARREDHHGMNEPGCLRKYTLSDAEQDGTLSFIASTYVADDDRIVMGITRPGPRIVDFGPMLKTDLLPLTALLKELLRSCQAALGTPVAIEFAMTFPDPEALPARFGFLQVRPMAASYSQVEVAIDELDEPNVLVASECALGNGAIGSIRDVVYVKPKTFETRHTRSIGLELEAINRGLVAAQCPYVLIGFGRWGTTDPSAGIPVDFGQISGARVIVESTLPNLDFTLSQGSHFFHNITSFKVLYFCVRHTGRHVIAWEWLDAQQALTETAFVRHVRLSSPLRIKVDGRTSRGVIVE